jgi:hypothetical protein
MKISRASEIESLKAYLDEYSIKGAIDALCDGNFLGE